MLIGKFELNKKDIRLARVLKQRMSSGLNDSTPAHLLLSMLDPRCCTFEEHYTIHNIGSEIDTILGETQSSVPVPSLAEIGDVEDLIRRLAEGTVQCL